MNHYYALGDKQSAAKFRAFSLKKIRQVDGSQEKRNRSCDGSIQQQWENHPT
jgi:hypothetical protein